MKKTENKPAFGTSSIGHNGISERDWFATFAPPATTNYVKIEMQKDHNANPHGDSYKPKRRSQIEIETQWRYKWADEMLKAREANHE